MRVLFIWLAMLFATPALAAHCTFQDRAGKLTGSCGPLFDDKPVFSLTESRAAPSGKWRSDMHPSRIWTGNLTDGDGTSPITLEQYRDGMGILRTEYGWFAVSHIALSNGLSFDLDAEQEIRPNEMDRRIVKRAAAILSSATVWNRADNRVCPTSATSWSIYCAMDKATIEISGAHDHRRPAMEVVRAIIDDRTANRKYDHRLMDYNNDPTTELADVQSLFREALMDMDNPAWLAKHGFAATTPF